MRMRMRVGARTEETRSTSFGCGVPALIIKQAKRVGNSN